MKDRLLMAMPVDSVDRFLSEANRRNIDPKCFLIRLIIDELPGALASAVRDRLTDCVECSDAAAPPAQTGGARDHRLPKHQVLRIITLGDLTHEDKPGGPARRR